MIYRRAILLAALMIWSATAAFPASVLMGRYDAQQTSYTAEKLQPPLILNWQFTANKYDNNPSAPVVDNGTCYIACGDYVYAVDLETGSMKWKYPTDQGLGGSVKGTPVLSNGMLYFGAGDGNLYCIDADTGTFQWAYQTRGAIRCPPIIADGVIFLGSDDNSLYAIQAESGDTAWKPFTARDDFAIGVAVGSGMLAAACMDGYMYGINANSGKLRWIFRLPSAPVKTSPVFTENVVVMAVGNMMYGASARSGQMRWSVTLPSEVAATPAVDGGDIYVPCHDRKIYAYTTSGRQLALKWTRPADLGGVPMSSPTVSDKILYATSSRGVVAAFSTVDGSEKWRYAISPSSITTPGSLYTDASSSPVVADGNLLVLTDDGVLHCFTPDAPDDEPPDVFNTTPATGIAISGAPPIKMSAVLYDQGSGVDYSSVAMFLDGQPVESLDIDVSTFTVSYQTETGGKDKPIRRLPDGVHTITLNAKDYAGNLLVKEWFFVADSTKAPPKRIISDKDTGKSRKEPSKRQPTPTPPTYTPPTNLPPVPGDTGGETPPPPPGMPGGRPGGGPGPPPPGPF